MYWTATGTHHSQTILKKRPGSLHSNYAVLQQETESCSLKTPADAAGLVSGFQDPRDIAQRQQSKQPHATLHVRPPHQAHMNSKPPALRLWECSPALACPALQQGYSGAQDFGLVMDAHLLATSSPLQLSFLLLKSHREFVPTFSLGFR